MFKMKFSLNGKPLQQGQLAREWMKAIEADILKTAKNSVKEVRCPVHGSGPTDVRVHEVGNRLRFEYESCCDELKSAVEAAFQEGNTK